MSKSKGCTISDKLDQMADGTWCSKAYKLQDILRDAVRHGIVDKSDMARAFGCSAEHLHSAYRTTKAAKMAANLRTLGFGTKD